MSCVISSAIAMQLKLQSLKEASFNLSELKMLWEMEGEHLSGALRLHTNKGRKGSESPQHLWALLPKTRDKDSWNT